MPSAPASDSPDGSERDSSVPSVPDPPDGPSDPEQDSPVPSVPDLPGGPSDPARNYHQPAAPDDLPELSLPDGPERSCAPYPAGCTVLLTERSLPDRISAGRWFSFCGPVAPLLLPAPAAPVLLLKYLHRLRLTNLRLLRFPALFLTDSCLLRFSALRLTDSCLLHFSALLLTDSRLPRFPALLLTDSCLLQLPPAIPAAPHPRPETFPAHGTPPHRTNQKRSPLYLHRDSHTLRTSYCYRPLYFHILCIASFFYLFLLALFLPHGQNCLPACPYFP